MASHVPSRSRLRLFQRRPAQLALEDVEPSFSDELEQALARLEAPLAAAIVDLQVVDACRCSDPDCASFYTVNRYRAAWLWHRGGRNIDVNPDITVDVVGDTVIAVEVHRRPALRAALERLLPGERER